MSVVSTLSSTKVALSESQSKKKVVYYYDEEVGNFYYGQSHPMKPHRIRMTHSLIVNYGLFRQMEVYRPYRLDERDMTLFHTDDYCHFLKTVTCENEGAWGTDLEKFNIDVDCPVFDGVYRFCQISAGGSVGGAYKLNHGNADIAVNWAGGLHHAKKSEASGFCYINDIVLSILELLKYHDRVLYVDVDIHHGDGVEEAFYTTDRVMTVSFHKYGDFFPGTGAIEDCGVLDGKYYSINVPLKEGINDITYEFLFKPVLSRIIEMYQPGAIVMQMGADSLAGDRLGCFNMTIAGHGECLSYVKTFGLPVLVLGGGGYTLRNVARCWTYETSICCGVELPNKIPYNSYYEYFAPDYGLATMATNMVNLNSQSDCQKLLKTVMQYLKSLKHAPSVQIHPDANRKEYALETGSEEFRKQVQDCNRVVENHVNQIKDKMTDFDDKNMQKDDALAKNDVDSYRLDRVADHNPDIRIPSIVQDRMRMDDREFYQNDQDQDKDSIMAVDGHTPIDEHQNVNINSNNNNIVEMKTMADVDESKNETVNETNNQKEENKENNENNETKNDQIMAENANKDSKKIQEVTQPQTQGNLNDESHKLDPK